MIRRDKIAQDGFDRLQEADLKQPLEIVFVDQFGQEEYVTSAFGGVLVNELDSRAGIDGGGVFKEFLTSIAKEVFDSDRGLWLSTEQHELYPNPHGYATDSTANPLYLIGYNTDLSPPAHSLSWFRFVGRILGKALYEGILVDVAFAGFFLAKVSCAMLFKNTRLLTGTMFPVARKAELFGRPRFIGQRALPRSHLPQTLLWRPRGPRFEFYGHTRRFRRRQVGSVGPGRGKYSGDEGEPIEIHLPRLFIQALPTD